MKLPSKPIPSPSIHQAFIKGTVHADKSYTNLTKVVTEISFPVLPSIQKILIPSWWVGSWSLPSCWACVPSLWLPSPYRFVTLFSFYLGPNIVSDMCAKLFGPYPTRCEYSCFGFWTIWLLLTNLHSNKLTCDRKFAKMIQPWYSLLYPPPPHFVPRALGWIS